MSLHQLKATAPVRVHARSFFEQALPMLLTMRPDSFRALGARFAFVLSGADGGAWTLDCASLTVAPRGHADAPAQVTLSLPTAAFEELMDGKLDVIAAERAGTVVIDGDRALLGALGPLLTARSP